MRNIKRKRITTTTSEIDGDTNLKEVNCIADKKRIIVDSTSEYGKEKLIVKSTNNFSSISSVINTSTSSLLSLKENLCVENKSDGHNENKLKSNDLAMDLITKSEETANITTITTTTTTTSSTSTSTNNSNDSNISFIEKKELQETTVRRQFKTKKTNSKNLQNKKISNCTNTKSAFNTIDNILTNNKNIGVNNTINENIVTSKTNNENDKPLLINKIVTTSPIKSQYQQNIKNLIVNDENLIPLPKLTWASNHELWLILKNKSNFYKYEYTYLRKHPGIEPQMRAILLDWIMEISYAYHLHRQTFHLAVEYIDRFMTITEKIKVDRLQLIGITALFIAAKVEEIYPPKLKDFAMHMDDYCSNNEEAISEFELYMLKTLNWQISPITVNSWLNIYLQIRKVNTTMNNNNNSQFVFNTSIVLPKELHQDYIKAISLIDLCLFDVESLKYKYSQIAACAMYYMIKPCDAVLSATGYKLEDLQSCINWMSTFAEIILENQDKIKLKKFSEIDLEDSHNIQLHFDYINFLKEAKLRKTPAKTTNLDENLLLLTPPDSNKKKN